MGSAILVSWMDHERSGVWTRNPGFVTLTLLGHQSLNSIVHFLFIGWSQSTRVRKRITRIRRRARLPWISPRRTPGTTQRRYIRLCFYKRLAIHFTGFLRDFENLENLEIGPANLENLEKWTKCKRIPWKPWKSMILTSIVALFWLRFSLNSLLS